MPIAEMAESPMHERDAGAPIAPDAIDPELIKLSRARPKIGIITAAGVVFLCVLFLIRLGPDRRFGGATDPAQTTAAAVAAGDHEVDQLLAVTAEPLIAHAIRAVKAEGDVGLRVVPARGTADRLWLVLSGDGWDDPHLAGYQGRLRRLADLPFADEVRARVLEHPRPVFATPAAARAALTTGRLATVAGDTMPVGDRDRVVFDVIDPAAASLVVSFTERLPSVAAWLPALVSADIHPASSHPPDVTMREARFEVPLAVAEVTRRLEAAELWAVRVEPVTRHHETTFGELRRSPATGFTAGAVTVPTAQVDVIGFYVTRAIPDDAYALIVGEQPADYWYVLPIMIALIAIGLVFAWALVRAVRRDLVPARA